MSSSDLLRVLAPVIQSVMPVQKLPEPTAAGIRSEASNRNTVSASWQDLARAVDRR